MSVASCARVKTKVMRLVVPRTVGVGGGGGGGAGEREVFMLVA